MTIERGIESPLVYDDDDGRKHCRSTTGHDRNGLSIAQDLPSLDSELIPGVGMYERKVMLVLPCSFFTVIDRPKLPFQLTQTNCYE
jgi:hypothetical protein